jgi:hypothetical protein
MELPFYIVVVTSPDMENEIVCGDDHVTPYQAQTEEEANKRAERLTQYYSEKYSCSYKVVRVG